MRDLRGSRLVVRQWDWEWICVRYRTVLYCRGKHVQFDADEWRELEASVRCQSSSMVVCGARSHACATPHSPPPPPAPPGCCCCSHCPSILRRWADEWGELAGRLFNIVGVRGGVGVTAKMTYCASSFLSWASESLSDWVNGRTEPHHTVRY